MSSVFVSVNVFNVGVNSTLSVSMDHVSGLNVNFKRRLYCSQRIAMTDTIFWIGLQMWTWRVDTLGLPSLHIAMH